MQFALDRLGVPVRALDQANGDDASRATSPVDHRPGVLDAALEIGLHRQPALEADLLHAPLEEGDGEVLQRVVLHVEVDEDALGLRRFENGHEPPHEVAHRSLGVDRIAPGREGRDLDRDVDAGNRPHVVRLESRIGLPRRHARRKIVDEIEVLAGVFVRLGVAHARLAEQVDAEGHALVPHGPKARQRAGRIHAGDELARHRLDLRGDGPRRGPREKASGLERGRDHARHRHARLREIVLEVIEDRLGRLEHREAVDEAEQLDLEMLVLHGPLHQGIVVELRGQQPRLVRPRPLEHLDSQGENPLLVAACCARRRGGTRRNGDGRGRGLGLAGEEGHGQG